MRLPMTTCDNLCDYLQLRDYLRQLAATCDYHLQLHVITCDYLGLLATTWDYLRLPATTCDNLRLPVTACDYGNFGTCSLAPMNARLHILTSECKDTTGIQIVPMKDPNRPEPPPAHVFFPAPVSNKRRTLSFVSIPLLSATYNLNVWIHTKVLCHLRQGVSLPAKFRQRNAQFYHLRLIRHRLPAADCPACHVTSSTPDSTSTRHESSIMTKWPPFAVEVCLLAQPLGAPRLAMWKTWWRWEMAVEQRVFSGYFATAPSPPHFTGKNANLTSQLRSHYPLPTQASWVRFQAGNPPGLPCVGIGPDDAALRRVFSLLLRIPALLRTRFTCTLISSQDLDVKSRPNLSTPFEVTFGHKHCIGISQGCASHFQSKLENVFLKRHTLCVQNHQVYQTFFCESKEQFYELRANLCNVVHSNMKLNQNLDGIIAKGENH
ncbi:hypothetical protein PR048_024557 [Dryococelus australis]|uniref:Envelope protein n=1 Tax=Dryococelus australis TaxID=614101 RepID=A0ABQ9GNV9_9NEOP|nr:hypothetical protein PR048_024557 [Dryococelus australis]